MGVPRILPISAEPKLELRRLGEDCLHYFAFDIGQAKVATGVAVGQRFVVEAEQMKDGGMEVVNVDLSFGDPQADVIGSSVDVPAFDSAAGHPNAEAVVVVIAAHIGRERHLRGRGPAKLAAPDDERVFQHASVFEVLEERGNGFVTLGGESLMGYFDSTVAIPGLAGSVPDLHVANAALGEAPRHEHLATLQGVAIHVSDGLRFLRDVKGIGGLGLHAKTEFERLDASFQLRIAGARLAVQFIELLNVAKLAALLSWKDGSVAQIGNETVGLSFLGVDMDALIDAGQEGTAPI